MKPKIALDLYLISGYLINYRDSLIGRVSCVYEEYGDKYERPDEHTMEVTIPNEIRGFLRDLYRIGYLIDCLGDAGCDVSFRGFTGDLPDHDVRAFWDGDMKAIKDAIRMAFEWLLPFDKSFYRS